jgi:S1-C subfamily serine protease
MPLPQQHKTFFLGLSISFLILVSFFGGALADRVFVIKPLDIITGKVGRPSTGSTMQQNALLAPAGSSVPDIAQAAAQSVVTISVRQTRQVLEATETDLFGLVVPGSEVSRRTELVKQDVGTGFVVEGGFIVTNRHVVQPLTNVEYVVIDATEREYAITNIYRDPSNDLAILKLETNQLRPIALGNSDAVRVGESVVAIGNALGEFRHTVTTGVVSGLGRGITAIEGTEFESLDDVIQTDAAMNLGNSGGPLINAQGQVIGVNVAVSAIGQNIGFAIPINVVKASLDNFNQTGQFDRPSLGVRYRMVSPQAAAFNNVPEGALITAVLPEGTAAKAGLRANDIITSFAGKAVTAETNLAALINQKKLGETVELEYWRGGQRTVTQLNFN